MTRIMAFVCRIFVSRSLGIVCLVSVMILGIALGIPKTLPSNSERLLVDVKERREADYAAQTDQT